jgi:hypothetical protein
MTNHTQGRRTRRHPRPLPRDEWETRLLDRARALHEAIQREENDW